MADDTNPVHDFLRAHGLPIPDPDASARARAALDQANATAVEVNEESARRAIDLAARMRAGR